MCRVSVLGTISFPLSLPLRRALWLNFPQRVGVIASWSAILNVAQPFR